MEHNGDTYYTLIFRMLGQLEYMVVMVQVGSVFNFSYVLHLCICGCQPRKKVVKPL